MLINSIKNGVINFNEFITGLYENKILSKKINEYQQIVDKSNNRVKEILKLLSEKSEDLYSHLEDIQLKKKKK